MENYVVSARKYRPARFDEVVGQEGVTTTLKNAIKSHHLAHSFLFCGPRGVGKTTSARILAKTINCENLGPDFEACNECAACKAFNSNSSFNVHELDAASNNTVDDMRTLMEQVRIQPGTGKYKIYIIDEVHMLSTAAFNAFLKTLEEPPSYAIFILATTEKHKIIPTILSRCQIFDFSRIQIPQIVAHLQKICKEESIAADENALHVIALKADGALRDALSMFDRLVDYNSMSLTMESTLTNLNILDYEYYFKVTDHLLMQDMSSTLLVYDEIIQHGFDGDEFLGGLMSHLRNLMVCKEEATAKLLEVSGQLRQRYIDQAAVIPDAFLLNALSIANQCDIGYKASKNKRLHVELALIRMCYIPSIMDMEITEAPILTGKKSEAAAPAKPQKTPSAAEKTPVAAKPKAAAPEKEAAPKSAEPAQVAESPKPVAEAAPAVKEEIVAEEKETIIATEIAKEEEEKAPVVEEAVVQDKAPQSEEKPQATKQANTPKVDFSEFTGSVSLSNLGKTAAADQPDDTAGQPAINEAEEAAKISIDETLFQAAWQEYTEKLKEDNRLSLHHVMLQVEPVLQNGHVQLMLENKLQMELFDNERTKLVRFLKDKLSVHYLTLETLVNKNATKKRKDVPYTAQEKLNKMIEKNPSIKTLKDKLDLRLDL